MNPKQNLVRTKNFHKFVTENYTTTTTTNIMENTTLNPTEIPSNTEIVSNWRGDVVVSNNGDNIPVGARYVTQEENPRRFVIYQKAIGGTLGSNPRLIVATILPLKIEGINAIERKDYVG